MWDDDQDKEMMRNQMRAIVIMAVLVFAWFYFFPMQPPVVQPGEEAPPFEQAASYPTGAGDFGSEGQTPAQQSVSSTASSLPPVADAVDPFLDSVSIGDEHIILTFTEIGARLIDAQLLHDSIQVVPQESADGGPATVYPLGLDFREEGGFGTQLDIRRFDSVMAANGRSVTFSLEIPGDFTLRKTFELTDKPNVVRVNIEFENHASQPRTIGRDATPAYVFNWAPDLITDEDNFRMVTQFIWRTDIDGDVQNETLTPSDLPAGQSQIVSQAIWVGYKTKYFMIAMRPLPPAGDDEAALSDAWLAGGEEGFQFGLASPRFDIPVGGKHTDQFELYIGPMELASLNAAWDSLPTALTFFTMTGFGWLDTFAKMLLSLMHWFHDHTIANWGVAIILMTVLVRTVMFPLTLKSTRSMKKMQALAPEVEILKEKYKEDQQELSRKMMEMYRERGVNPMGGCFPMLIQMPVFIALYRMLWNAYEMRGAPFLWVEDLSKPDHLFHMPFMSNVPLVGQYLEYFNILPLLMGVAMILNMKIMPQAAMQNPQQKMIMNMMPIMFAVFCYPLAAGLNLYVLTSTILGMAQQALVRGVTPEVTAESIKKKPKRKNRANWYDNAMAKKKENEKEQKRAKKQETIEKREHGNGDAEAKKNNRGKKGNKGKKKQSAKRGKKHSKS